MDIYNQSFTGSFSYPVVFGRGLLNAGRCELLSVMGDGVAGRPHRVMAVVDGGLAACQPDLSGMITAWADSHTKRVELVMPPLTVPGGEAVKNDYRKLMEIVDLMLEHRLCRHSYVLIIGGGAVLDAVGLAASLVHRGVRVIRMPSTVLAQNDAGIGVKNGMNLHGGKNTIGTFQVPHAVLNDFSLLDSLSDANWLAGVSEAFKVAFIKDADFFNELCDKAASYPARDKDSMEYLVRRCAELHLEHIATSGDPFEQGAARPLDFGHWAAHKLESMSNYRIGHGQAVAAGMAIDASYAQHLSLISSETLQRFLDALAQSGLPVWYPEMDRRLGDGSLEILQGLDDFQEHLGGQLTVTLPEGVGQRKEIHEVDRDVMTAMIRQLASTGVTS